MYFHTIGSDIEAILIKLNTFCLQSQGQRSEKGPLPCQLMYFVILYGFEQEIEI